MLAREEAPLPALLLDRRERLLLELLEELEEELLDELPLPLDELELLLLPLESVLLLPLDEELLELLLSSPKKARSLAMVSLPSPSLLVLLLPLLELLLLLELLELELLLELPPLLAFDLLRLECRLGRGALPLRLRSRLRAREAST